MIEREIKFNPNLLPPVGTQTDSGSAAAECTKPRHRKGLNMKDTLALTRGLSSRRQRGKDDNTERRGLCGGFSFPSFEKSLMRSGANSRPGVCEPDN